MLKTHTYVRTYVYLITFTDKINKTVKYEYIFL